MRELAFVCFVFFCSIAFAQEMSHTIELKEGEESPSAALDDVAWIQGHWRGEALGGQIEEIWSPPLGDSMMGSFKLVQNDQVEFYEIMTISELDQTLILRIKHFHSDLKGWEEKDQTVDFKLVKVTPGIVYFDGLSFEKVSEDEINVYVIFDSKEKRSEAKFNYRRIDSSE